MADQTFVITECIKAGLLDLTAHANKLAGNAAGADWWYMPNDGKTILAVVAGAAVKTISVTPVVDKYGRTETLTLSPTASKTSLFGPFLPELWNDSAGRLKFKPNAGGDVGDIYLAVRVSQPT